MAGRIAALVFAVVAGVASPVAAQLRGETIARGLTNPVAVVADPTDRSTLFVVEQRGLIRVVREGRVVDEPFLDLRDQISSGGERGLLGLAFTPDHGESRRFFVNFTNRNGDTVIARFRRDAQVPLRTESGSRFDLLWPTGRRDIEQPFSNHNGGHLAFGPDGFLYVGLGDGGSGGDPMNNAQRGDTLLGKMLRLDVNVPDDDARGYRIPEDNPFVEERAVRALDEIWAFGLRNPWRYTFDDWTRGGTGALVIADVGQDAREEINFAPNGAAGFNYGWRIREGRQPYDPRTGAAFLPLTEPIHDYGRAIGASITGGFIYRGEALDPAFQGRYFYADFISGRVFSIGVHLDEHGDARADDEREHTSQLGGRETLGMVSSFGQDHDGELLVANYSGGTVVRIVPDFGLVPAAPVAFSGAFVDDIGTFGWSMPAGDANAVDYVVERIRDGRVVQRITFERREATLSAAAGDCFQVRARARNGTAGPPSSRICAPQP